MISFGSKNENTRHQKTKTQNNSENMEPHLTNTLAVLLDTEWYEEVRIVTRNQAHVYMKNSTTKQRFYKRIKPHPNDNIFLVYKWNPNTDQIYNFGRYMADCDEIIGPLSNHLVFHHFQDNGLRDCFEWTASVKGSEGYMQASAAGLLATIEPVAPTSDSEYVLK